MSEYSEQIDSRPLREWFQERIQSAPWWLISLCAHIALLMLLKNVSFAPPGKTPDTAPVQVTISTAEEPAVLEEQERVEFMQGKLEITAPNFTPTAEMEESAELVEDSASAETAAQGELEWESEFDDLAAVRVAGVSGGGGSAPGIYSARASMGSRALAIRRHGGNRKALQAVEKGLEYLARIQNRDGSWGTARQAGGTGVCLLAFLGAGYTQKSGKYRQTVSRAIEYLLSLQKDGKFTSPGGSDAYDHGVAAFSIAECFALTRDQKLRKPVEDTVSLLTRAQCKQQGPYGGGWGYGLAGDAPTTSITNWQVQTIASARIGGVSVPADVISNAKEYYAKNFVRSDGRTYYRKGSEYDDVPMGGSSAGGVYCRLLLGVQANDETVRRGIEWIKKNLPQGFGGTWGNPTQDEYFWYYATLACFHVGGRDWKFWNEHISKFLLDSQLADGSWMHSGYGRYVGDEIGKEGGKRPWSTALPILILEVYYRYQFAAH